MRESVNSRSTVRIVNEAIRLLQNLTPDNDTQEEEIENNLTELEDLSKKLHRRYPVMRSDD